MVTILFAVVSIFVFRFRSRAVLELKLVALEHQLAVLRRQRPGRPQLSSLDRLLWVLLYRIWPQVIDAMVLVKPTTVVEWHRKGFRLYWRWRSRRPGRPRISTEIRDLIRRMSSVNPLGTAHLAICCGTEISPMVQYSVIAFERWASRRLSLRRDLRGRTPMPSVLSARSAENVWITSSSSASAICTTFYRAIFNTIMTPE